jgi:hypothetical protein
VFSDPLGGQGALTGAQQRGAGPAVAGGDQPAGGLDGGGVGEQGAPVTGQDHAIGAAPGGQARGDERLGRGDRWRAWVATTLAWISLGDNTGGGFFGNRLGINQRADRDAIERRQPP